MFENLPNKWPFKAVESLLKIQKQHKSWNLFLCFRQSKDTIYQSDVFTNRSSFKKAFWSSFIRLGITCFRRFAIVLDAILESCLKEWWDVNFLSGRVHIEFDYSSSLRCWQPFFIYMHNSLPLYSILLCLSKILHESQLEFHQFLAIFHFPLFLELRDILFQ